MTIWYEILFIVNSIRKNFQSKNNRINVDIELLNDLVAFFKNIGKKVLKLL